MINIISISLSFVVFFYSLCLKTKDNIKSVGHHADVFLSWGTINAFFNPVLNDSALIFLVSFFVLFQHNQVILLVLMFFSFFLFPGFFIIPMVLYLFMDCKGRIGNPNILHFRLLKWLYITTSILLF